MRLAFIANDIIMRCYSLVPRPQGSGNEANATGDTEVLTQYLQVRAEILPVDR